MKLFIGADTREHEAYRVAERSLARVSDLQPTALEFDRLRDCGLLRRSIDRRGDRIHDLISDAPWSTEFAVSRFLTPILAQTGWALFTDCDVVFLRNPEHLKEYTDPTKALMVVPHRQEGGPPLKMDGQLQTHYARKNWSSVMLFNCDHPANRRLTLRDVNERPGRDLHRFYWLSDSEIGFLAPEWNWLVGVEPKPDHPAIAHYTLGGPWLHDWKPQPHDDIWWAAAHG